MRKLIFLVAAAATVAACGRDTTYEEGGEVDTVDTTGALLPDLDVDLTRDTVNVPTLGTERDTIIVDKPVITGRKPVEVAKPTVRRDSSS
jgi:hypothetical protein